MAAKKGIKVSKLAEDLKIDPKDLLATLKDLGVSAKTSASVISEEDTKAVKELLSQGKKKEELKEPEVKEEKKAEDVEEAPSKEAAAAVEIKAPPKKSIIIFGDINVKELSEKLETRPGSVIKELMRLGVMATINQRVDINVVREVAKVFGVEVISQVKEEGAAVAVQKEEAAHLVHRPPIVVVMGHVDHGKTKLLDAIRKTNVIATEHGGITQHIGAYQVEVKGKKVTFLDTPGHEAFTALRSRGAKVADIAVLVVAADDGIMPQTVEAINHAKAASVPIIIAINKIDRPEADVERVKKQLTEHELVPEEWGGKTVVVSISAKQGTGIDALLEMILLTAELQELKANPLRSATGIIVEAKLDKGRGPVATVLIGNGTLEIGDTFYVGGVSGKVRALIDDNGKNIKKALPAQPVEVLGSESVPVPGEVFRVVHDDQTARKLSEKKRLEIEQAKQMKGKVLSLEDFSRTVKEGIRKDLNIILKADVQGSIEAIKSLLQNLTTADVRVNIIHNAAGGISESDVMLALASKAIIIGFNVSYEGGAKLLADDKGVDTRLYNIIYKVADDVKAAMTGLLEPVKEEVILGHAMVKALFKYSKVGVIAGCIVKDGKIQRGAYIRVLREGKQLYEGRLDSLKRFKEDAKEVQTGFECGVSVPGYTDFVDGDVIECFEVRTAARKL
ncbi:MAG: translation initiation factor IF-2 [bacterium]